eukprot:6957193-Pyramimonas_sp.AAC.1
MLRKRGVNPAGSRQVLQERLEDYLIGDNLDCDFKPPPTPEGDQSAPRGPPSFQPVRLPPLGLNQYVAHGARSWESWVFATWAHPRFG